MPNLPFRDLPDRGCLENAAKSFPEMDPSASEAILCLLRAGDDVAAYLQEHMHDFGLTPGAFSVLMLLVDKNNGAYFSSTPAELAEKGGVSRATITGILDTLQKLGLISREADMRDRRVVLVHLTAKGRETIERMLPVHFGAIRDFMIGVSEEDREQLTSLCRGLMAVAERRAKARLGEGSKGDLSP